MVGGCPAEHVRVPASCQPVCGCVAQTTAQDCAGRHRSITAADGGHPSANTRRQAMPFPADLQHLFLPSPWYLLPFSLPTLAITLTSSHFFIFFSLSSAREHQCCWQGSANGLSEDWFPRMVHQETVGQRRSQWTTVWLLLYKAASIFNLYGGHQIHFNCH